MCYNKPHGQAPKSTICRWLKEVLSGAGIDVGIFSAHSFRSASTSAAYNMDVPLDTILQTAGWSNAKTFRKLYHRPIKEKDNAKFANSILNYFVTSNEAGNSKG